MELQCECGKFQVVLMAFPKNTPGRLRCYCDDCQTYLHLINRSELLDQNGGSEVIPVYPRDVQILKGKEYLKCMRLSPKGIFRFSTSCCNTPVANTKPGFWLGFHRILYATTDPTKLDNILGPVRSSIMGRFAKGTLPAGTPDTYNLKSFICVMPFMLKGKLLKKFKGSPFFEDDGETPVVTSHMVPRPEKNSARALAGFPKF